MNRKLHLLMGLLLVFMASCGNYEEIEVRNFSIKNVKMESSSVARVELNVTLYNPSSNSILLQDASGALSRNNKHLANFILLERVLAPADGLNTVTVPIRVELIDVMQLFTSGLSLRNFNPEDFFVDGKLRVRYGFFGKTFKVHDASIAEIMSRR